MPINHAIQLSCPHCGTGCPQGAAVCTGCHAEIMYGGDASVGGMLFLCVTGLLFLWQHNIIMTWWKHNEVLSIVALCAPGAAAFVAYMYWARNGIRFVRRPSVAR